MKPPPTTERWLPLEYIICLYRDMYVTRASRTAYFPPIIAYHCVFVNGLSSPSRFSFAIVDDVPL